MTLNTPCQWLVTGEDDEGPYEETCGLPSVAEVAVKTRVTTALVWLCPKHKKEHSAQYARLRIARKNNRAV